MRRMTHPLLTHHPIKVQTTHGQHAHALSYACFFKTNFPLLLLFWVDQSVYLCLQYLCTSRSLDAGHLCRCVIDFECVFVRVWSLYSMSIINNLKIGHFYLLYQVHLDAILLVSPGKCLLQQHHSLIFNSQLNSVSWTFICCVFF